MFIVLFYFLYWWLLSFFIKQLSVYCVYSLMLVHLTLVILKDTCVCVCVCEQSRLAGQFWWLYKQTNSTDHPIHATRYGWGIFVRSNSCISNVLLAYLNLNKSDDWVSCLATDGSSSSSSSEGDNVMPSTSVAWSIADSITSSLAVPLSRPTTSRPSCPMSAILTNERLCRKEAAVDKWRRCVERLA